MKSEKKNGMNFNYIFIALLFSFSLFLINCSKGFNDVIIPNDKEIDIDSDGKTDIKVNYTKTNIDKLPRDVDIDTLTFDRSVTCNIQQLNNNELLLENVGLLNWQLPSLNYGDTINIESLEDKFLSNNQAANLMTIRRFNNSSEWETNWGNLSSDSPVIVIKINSSQVDKLCWFQLELDNNSGEVQVANQKCHNSNTIIIEE